MTGIALEELEYTEESVVDTELTQDEAQQIAEVPASSFDAVVSQVLRIAVEVLNQFTIGRVVLRALEQAKLKRQEQHIKAQIKEMVNEGEFTVVSIDVLDELNDDYVCTVEVECQQVDEIFQPGDVIHNLVY